MSFQCSSCGHAEYDLQEYPRVRENPLRFSQIFVCRACGFGKVDTQLQQAEIETFYQNGNYWEQVTPSPDIIIHYRTQASERIKKIRRILPSQDIIRVLDIGSGFGFIGEELVNYVSPSIVDYAFIEPDDELAKRTISLQSAHLKVQRLTSLKDGKPSSYDLIFLNQVLEHVLNPKEFLGEVKGLLSHEGRIYIEVPNFDCAYKSDVFPHTLFFTPISLRNVLSANELIPIALEPFGNKETSLGRKLSNKIFIKLQSLFLKSNFQRPVKLLDMIIFGYRNIKSDGRWLYAITGHGRTP